MGRRSPKGRSQVADLGGGRPLVGKGGGQGVDDLPLEHGEVVVDGELSRLGIGFIDRGGVFGDIELGPEDEAEDFEGVEPLVDLGLVDGGGRGRGGQGVEGPLVELEELGAHHLPVVGFGFAVVGVGDGEDARGRGVVGFEEFLDLTGKHGEELLLGALEADPETTLAVALEPGAGH
jgi:hypothetical protein